MQRESGDEAEQLSLATDKSRRRRKASGWQFCGCFGQREKEDEEADPPMRLIKKYQTETDAEFFQRKRIIALASEGGS